MSDGFVIGVISLVTVLMVLIIASLDMTQPEVDEID